VLVHIIIIPIKNYIHLIRATKPEIILSARFDIIAIKASSRLGSTQQATHPAKIRKRDIP
jgi:hypothetical protein